MHVAVDLNWFLRFIGFAFAAVCGLLYLVRNTASKYFVVDSNFDSSAAAEFSSDHQSKREKMTMMIECPDNCAVCGLATKKQCAGCKMVKYCSEACQISHWNSEHKNKCKDLQSSYKRNLTKSTSALRGRKTSVAALGGSSKIRKLPDKMLFPYEEFVELFNWNKPGYPPCGLLNCGNSCFANVVLQCLAYTRPLVAYLLEKGHRIDCQRDDWCFFCEFQTHVERASRSIHPFSPINILSRLPNIGGNLGYGKQEDAHEFIRFAIDNMQSACLDEFGGEKAVHPSYQETTFIQHIFGGRLQSQVVCTECNNVSNQYENMMDLTVEIHGDAESLEECLDQFTAKEQLHGDNMYKCDGCNAYVTAWKHLAVRRAPNVLTIALKRFQSLPFTIEALRASSKGVTVYVGVSKVALLGTCPSGRYGKLNKRVTFPETLDLSPYMSELEDGNDVYKLYAVIVHLDMLNASFFGHYICYVKDFSGNWYRIDDCKVASVDLDEVLSQGAYMLMYNRICARPSCLLPAENIGQEENKNVKMEVDPSPNEPAEGISASGCLDNPVDLGKPSSSSCSGLKVNSVEDLSSVPDAEAETGAGKLESEQELPLVKDVELPNGDSLSIAQKEVTLPTSHAEFSLIDEITTQQDVQYPEASAVSIVGNAGLGAKSDANEDLSGRSAEESSVAENCTFEESNNRGNSCSFAIVNDEVLDEVKPARPTSTLENGSAIPEVVQNASEKSSGECSATKLKPAFAPGFLDKRPRKKFIKPEDKVPMQFSELAPISHLNTQTKDVAKPHLSFENGALNEKKTRSVHENGMASMESQECWSVDNGDSGENISPHEGVKANITNGMLPVQVQDPVCDNNIRE